MVIESVLAKDYGKSKGLSKVNKKDFPALSNMLSYVATARVELIDDKGKRYFINKGDVVIPMGSTFALVPKADVKAIESIAEFVQENAVKDKKNTNTKKPSDGVVHV